MISLPAIFDPLIKTLVSTQH